MIYCFDVDGTICTLTNGKYRRAKPIQTMIDRINQLFDLGHYIKIYTARGMTKSDPKKWYMLTHEQLQKWGVKYHSLIMGKPSADFYVDDKAVPAEKFVGQLTVPLVFTNGCFDIIHAGHIKLLREASRYGNVVVGVNSDNSVKRIKGDSRPINNLDARMTVLSAIRYIWHVVDFDEDTPENLIKELKPDILVKGSDWKEEDIVGAEFVKSYGGRVIRVDLLEGHSTTRIIGYCDLEEDKKKECPKCIDANICGLGF